MRPVLGLPLSEQHSKAWSKPVSFPSSFRAPDGSQIDTKFGYFNLSPSEPFGKRTVRLTCSNPSPRVHQPLARRHRTRKEPGMNQTRLRRQLQFGISG